ncbi:Rhodanese-related sulfurtransferase [Nitrosomonas sp. Nm51]|uniref:rhodanese-like domain-containing protein n=1 Tax=Nitrosomonas sp. Nm51 TaxID=133720 RepID=UPI0008B8F825|nr:rhodanese-like domain-containing protein [Nitrosomonas sp. Nm51]SER63302.1 Rhodanese-related sulfurtransferase [Nitrosomonas sp. Nm51]
MRIFKYFTGACLLGLAGFAIIIVVSPAAFLKTTYALIALEFDKIPTISSKSLHPQLMSNNFRYVIVDVRTPEERRVSMIPGAISQKDFERNRTDYQNKKIVVYCTIGYRSGHYARLLRQQGFDAYNLSEGILGWTHIGGQLINAQGQATRRIHVYSRPWNLAVSDHTVIF